MPVVQLIRAAPGYDIARVVFPYSPEVTEAIRRIPGRAFNRTYKFWTFPLTPANVLLLREDLKRYGWALEMPPDVAAQLNQEWKKTRAAHAVRAAGDSDIAFDFLTEPYAHQRAGLQFLVHLDGGALLWEMGLGKTKTAIDFAEYLTDQATAAVLQPGGLNGPDAHLFRVLVICPNTVKANWGAEISKHAGHDDYVIPRGTLAKRVEKLATARYTIINAEALSHKVMASALRMMDWDLVIVDESTRFKTMGAERTKALMKIRTKRRVILTGTPITGKPQDAYVQFEWVRPGTFGNSYYVFAERYLQKDWFGNVVGINPHTADELRSRIDSVGYRILKTDVLDLPEKVYTTRTVTMAGEQQRAYNQMRDELRIQLADNTEVRANNILTVVLRLTQVTAGLIGQQGDYLWIPDNAKLVELRHLLNEELANEQVVIFGLYQEELRQLAYEFVPGAIVGGNPPIIYGPTPERDRQEFVDQFQRGDRRLLFCQTRTGGIGINLTAARNAIYYTRGWSLEEWLQSQDRLHRIGQTGTVNIVPLVAEGSIDEDIADALGSKKNMADFLTGDGARELARKILGK